MTTPIVSQRDTLNDAGTGGATIVLLPSAAMHPVQNLKRAGRYPKNVVHIRAGASLRRARLSSKVDAAWAAYMAHVAEHGGRSERASSLFDEYRQAHRAAYGSRPLGVGHV
ncbi:hypothetical protein [uncultured Pseudacidovorax sp.]|uniref:hypothetical protein n=1 Tax=uncultured Pseudacidovorax sp. TaxID=679313 RepID=UPI0025D98F97|nr:hypothetical protein [uncultured Pseudacidovorax sp.]